MGWYTSWAAKQKGKTSLLVIAFVSGSLCFWVGYRKYYSPWRTRQRLQESEEYAKFLLQSEQQ